MNQTTKRPTTWKAEINLEINTVHFYLYDNVKQAPVPTYDLRFNFDKMHPDIKKYPHICREAIAVGFEDSVRDAGALGAGATNRAKYEAMKERGEYLESGAPQGWERKGVRGPSDTSLLYQVLNEAFPHANPTETILKMHADATKQQVTWKAYMDAILATPELKPIADRIREEGAKAKNLVGSELLKNLGLTLAATTKVEAPKLEVVKTDDKKKA